MHSEHMIYYNRETFSVLGLMCHLWTLKLHSNGCSIIYYVYTYTRMIHLD